MSVNLLRNSKVFFTTNVELADPDRGKIKANSHTVFTTIELQVLDDLSFNQTTAVETIAVNEAGTTPVRGQRQFNTALNPVDFNFSTYLRPAKIGSVGGRVEAISARTNLPAAGAGSINPVTPAPANINFRSWDSNTDVWDTNRQNAYNAHTGLANQAVSTHYGPNTTVQVALQDARGKPLILAPIFGTAPTQTVAGTPGIPNPTFDKLLGFRIVDPGEGYSQGTNAIAATVFDPDAQSEVGEVIEIVIDRVSSSQASKKISCEEAHLWNAMFSPDQPFYTPGTFTNTIGSSNGAFKEANYTTAPAVNPATVELIHSNSHQLQRFGMIVVFDQNAFLLDDCSLTEASIDFGIDQIATIKWSGQARAIRRIASPTLNFPIVNGVTVSGDPGSFTGSLTGAFRGKITDAPFIANKLSTVTLAEEIGSFGSSPGYTFTPNSNPNTKQYTIPITAGNIMLQNNITYLTPAYMGAVNQAVTYFTGSRNISGSLTAYLRTGVPPAFFTADLFSDLVAKVNTDSDPQFALQIEIGGKTNASRVELTMPAVVLTIPTINAESVITSAINFTAQGSDQQALNKTFDILKDNEIMIKYFV